MKRLLHRLSVLALLALLTSCGTTRESTEAPAEGQALLRVINRNGLSMEIYVEGFSRRVRLGRVPAGKTQVFKIPADLTDGATLLQFTMQSNGPTPAVMSEAVTVVPGDEVLLVIPSSR